MWPSSTRRFPTKRGRPFASASFFPRRVLVALAPVLKRQSGTRRVHPRPSSYAESSGPITNQLFLGTTGDGINIPVSSLVLRRIYRATYAHSGNNSQKPRNWYRMSDGKLYEAGITNVFNLPTTVKCTVYVTSQPIQGEPNADDEYPSPKGLQARRPPPTRRSNTIRPFPFSIFPVRHVDNSYTPDPPRRLQVCGEVKLVSHLSRYFRKSPLSTKT